jgi:small GTP-binding protein
MNEPSAIPVKIIVVGSINVGKTSLVAKYATGKNPGKTQTTKTASYIEKIKIVNGIKFEIKLWDTAGQEKYKCLTKLFIKDAKIALLVYSIDNEQSFKDLDDWLELIKNTNKDLILYGIAANKSDLASDETIPDEKGKEYAKKIGAEWKSTSAILEGGGIEEFIDELFIKYHTTNFKVNEVDLGQGSESLSITLSNEASTRTVKKGCCGGKTTEYVQNNENKKHGEHKDRINSKKSNQ